MSTRSTIHHRLLMLAIAVALPLVGLVGYGIWRLFEADRAKALHDLEVLQQINLESTRAFVDATRLKLERLARHPRILGMDPTQASVLLHDVVQASPDLADVRLIDLHGGLVASALPADEEARRTTGQRPTYIAAREAEKFHISEPYPGSGHGIWTCLVSQPVKDGDGRRLGTIVAPLRLTEMASLLHLPTDAPGLVVGLTSSDGIIVLRRPDPERYIGRKTEQIGQINALLDAGQSRIEAPGFDGLQRMALVSRVETAPWIVVTSLPKESILRSAKQTLWQALGACAIVFALGVYLVSRYATTIEAPIMALADAARDQTAGQTEHLAPVSGPAEVAETARAFNEMVAARRQAEELLAQSEKRYRTVIDQTGQMVYDLDIATGVNLWFGSEAVPAITGYSLAEFQSVDVKRWEEMIHPEDRRQAVALLDEAIARGGRYIADYRFRCKDGSYRYIEDVGVCLPGPNGKITRLLGRMGDITDRRQAERALRESEDRYRLVMEQTGQLIYDLDVEKMQVRWFGSAAAQLILGCTPEEFSALGVDGWRSRLHPDDAEAAVERLRHSLRTGDPCQAEYRLRDSQGEYHLVEERGVVLRDADGVIRRMVGRMTDITLRRQAEEERQQIGRKLQETQKLESLGVLAGGIAHDFNNLLTGILGNAGLARLEAPAGWTGSDNLGQIEKAALRAADLCKQMLAYSGKGRFVVQRISLNELLEESAQLLQISISKKATLELSLDPAIPAISADATQIRQIVMNLVINASEALGDRTGRIMVTTGRVQATSAYLATVQFHTEVTPGEYVFLEVGDNGCGMSRETLARIFDPFFTTKFTGRGLGLAAVLGIVRGHKGAIKVYSEPGRGTTFRVLLPPVAGTPQPLSRPAAPAPEWRGQGHVLVIDDEESVRSVARSVLEFAGFTVEDAPDGAAGVAAFARDPRRFTAVLLDLTMPQMDGEEAFRQLRLLNPGVCVMLMSGFNRVDAINRFVGKGLAGFVQKPFEVQTLIGELRRVLECPAKNT